MGPSLSRHLSYSDEYSASDSIRSDPWLRRTVDEATSVIPDLHAAIVSHLTWVVSESRNGLIEDLTTVDPNFTLHVSEAVIDDNVERLKKRNRTAIPTKYVPYDTWLVPPKRPGAEKRKETISAASSAFESIKFRKRREPAIAFPTR